MIPILQLGRSCPVLIVTLGEEGTPYNQILTQTVSHSEIVRLLAMLTTTAKESSENPLMEKDQEFVIR